jgi:hypothetical protein
MVRSARPIQYIVSGLPTLSSATAERRPLTPRTTTQVRLFQQLLDKQTGALLALPLYASDFCGLPCELGRALASRAKSTLLCDFQQQCSQAVLYNLCCPGDLLSLILRKL